MIPKLCFRSVTAQKLEIFPQGEKENVRAPWHNPATYIIRIIPSLHPRPSLLLQAEPCAALHRQAHTFLISLRSLNTFGVFGCRFFLALQCPIQ